MSRLDTLTEAQLAAALGLVADDVSVPGLPIELLTDTLSYLATHALEALWLLTAMPT